MLKYIARKIVAMIPKIIVISLIIFFALQALPGDPISRSVSPDTWAKMTPEQLEALRESLGLNKPLVVQYFSWAGKLLKGDFGYSLSKGTNIREMLAGRLPYTIELAIWGVLFANLFGMFFGFIAAIRKNRPVDYGLTTLSILGISVPDFFFGIVFILFFALTLKVLPTGGRMSAGETGAFSRVKYLVLPVLTLSISLLATMTRYTRGSMLDVLNKDYIKTARSKGLGEFKVNVKHAFRNALTPIMVLLCFRLPMLVSGTVVVESVYNYPGMGSMILDAISSGDMPVVMITTMIVAIVTLVASNLVDIFTALLDPRVRLD
ncbi:MAG: ABC transporter permease [Lachnospiraceae bacterium]|nr:ABC transporter permease [Lachnospiraceae bacterium]